MNRSLPKSPRVKTARVILLGHVFSQTMGLFINLMGIALKWLRPPAYRPIWLYTILLAVSLGAALLAIRWLDHSLRLAMWMYAVVGALALTALLVHDAMVVGNGQTPLLIALFHVGVLALGLALGFKDAVVYATLVSILCAVLGILYGDSGTIFASIAVAYAMTLPFWLIERMEIDLLKSEECFGIVFRDSLDVILIVDPDTREIIRANRAAESILGYDSEQLAGKPFASLSAPLPNQPDPDLLLGLDTTSAIFGSHRFLRADGSPCPMDLTATRIPWGNRKVTLVTLRDVAEREATEQELRLYRRQLEELVEARTAALQARNEELDAFAHTVAHDLKSPLTRLIGASKILQTSYEDLSAEERRYYLEAIEEGSYRMSSIIEELMLLAGVRQSDDMTLSTLDMASIIEEAEERLSYLIKKYDAEIIKPERWPAAMGYAPWVEEIWVNYLSNAIKYGGVPPQVELGYSFEAHQGRLCFWVRDNGEGLTNEQVARLFVPFTRIDETRAEGDGVGLSIVRRIVEKLGGDVEVESAQGEGSVFSFSLPAAEDVDNVYAATIGARAERN